MHAACASRAWSRAKRTGLAEFILTSDSQDDGQVDVGRTYLFGHVHVPSCCVRSRVSCALWRRLRGARPRRCDPAERREPDLPCKVKPSLCLRDDSWREPSVSIGLMNSSCRSQLRVTPVPRRWGRRNDFMMCGMRECIQGTWGQRRWRLASDLPAYGPRSCQEVVARTTSWVMRESSTCNLSSSSRESPYLHALQANAGMYAHEQA